MTRTTTPHRTELRFRPVDLDGVPEVDALLRRIGTGPFDRTDLTALPGRNDTWAGRTTGGALVFVKRLTGPPEDVRARMGRALAYERMVADAPADVLRGPALLGSDPDAGLLAFDYLQDARSGAELMADQEFTPELAHRAGLALGRLHARPAGPLDALERSAPALPSPEPLEALPAAVFEELSGAELETWRLLQNDAPLIGAVHRLLADERAAPRVPAHCDLRMDQFLITGRPGPDAVLHVADWEEFRLADPARDVGGFAGEWLHRAVHDIVTTRGDADTAAFAGLSMTRETVLARGAEKLTRLRPVVQEFWRGYRAARPDADPGLAERATAFAGWHLLDRLLAGAARSNRLLGIERAAAGIGRTALLDPARFTHVVGLGDAS
ncbi:MULTISPECIES: class V lanthionine synthetase subunit LxmK [unclassified Streptomyces]|uniref:class V lanthionine synthetase subunit LxmK n=1 Tax=unclassified Streptomyces TaxID=2593676 RepID=UPI00364A8715